MIVSELEQAKQRDFIAQAKNAGRKGAIMSRPERFRENKPVNPPLGAKAVTLQKLGAVVQYLSVFGVTLRAASLRHEHRKDYTFLHCYDLAELSASQYRKPEPLLSLLVKAGDHVQRDDLAVDFPNGLAVTASADPDGHTSRYGPRLAATLWLTPLPCVNYGVDLIEDFDGVEER